MASYLPKVADFNLYSMHLAPTIGTIPFEFRRDLWYQKTRVPALSCSVILCDSRFSRFDKIPARDGHTHTQTHHDGIYRASIASRGKNDLSYQHQT